MIDALIRLGADVKDIHWLDIPYTSNARVREHVIAELSLEPANLRVCDDYRVLDPYPYYQHRRTVNTVIELGEASDQPLIVLDDGAYVLKALSALRKDRWPRPIALVEQTTRGIIKMNQSAAMRAVGRDVPLVDVAQSSPKRTLEPPFVAMAVCASLKRTIDRLAAGREFGRILVSGYGAIGEQVATYLSAEFHVDKQRVFIHDPDDNRTALAARRGFSSWDASDLAQRFDLVVGCSGRASFGLGDREYLGDGALLASASSGAVELSRRDFVELADASDLDDIEIRRDGLDERNLHADIEIRLVDRVVTFTNAGFPVNFDGGIKTIPSRFIQQTPVMMAAAAIQASEAISEKRTGLIELDHEYCTWIETHFRNLLGDDEHYLIPPPEEAW